MRTADYYVVREGCKLSSISQSTFHPPGLLFH